MWGCLSHWETLIDLSSLPKNGTETCDTWTLKPGCDVVMMSQRLWHHMGLIIEGRREEEVCRERSEADGGGGVGGFFSSWTEQSCVCVRDRPGLVNVCVCVCVHFPVEETPWFHKHRRGIHSSRKTTAPLTAFTAHTLKLSAHTHTQHTHSYTLHHQVSSVFFVLNPISSSLIIYLDWSCGTLLFAGEKWLVQFNCCLFSSFCVGFLFVTRPFVKLVHLYRILFC